MTAGSPASWRDVPRYRAPQVREGSLTHGGADWSGLRVLVAGLGLSGFAAADALLERGAQVRVTEAATGGTVSERARILEVLGAQVHLGERLTEVPGDVELLVPSPGIPPRHPLLADAEHRGVPIWAEVELAWRMRPEAGAAPWLTVTGTNGKTTTVTMLESILRAGGLRATAAGNVGLPILEAVLHPQPYQVLAVELSTFQLHYAPSVSPHASAVLNVVEDHLDWHGDLAAYQAAKGWAYENTQVACLYNEEDPLTRELLEQADVVDGCRAVGFTLGSPAVSMLGVVDGILADRAFVEERRSTAQELATVDDLAHGAPSVPPHIVANALAAAGLARAIGVPAEAVRDGLRGYTPQPHRVAEAGAVGEVRFVDDSKATNPPAARASLLAFPSVVWVAGGQLKGADVDALVAEIAPRLRGAVLLGQDRAVIGEALARHAPDLPVADVMSGDTGSVAAVMDRIVSAALDMAQPGDVVLLAPAGASWDMFPNYGTRGDEFVAAVRRRNEGAEPAR